MEKGLFDDKKTVRRVFRKVLVLSLLALFCATALLSIANDTYAFFKPQRTVALAISPPCTLDDFSRLLEENGVLLHPHLFSLYVKSKQKSELVERFSGELVLDSSMSYREILQALAKNSSTQTE